MITIDNIREMHNLLGMTYKQIGQQFGVSASCVMYWDMNGRVSKKLNAQIEPQEKVMVNVPFENYLQLDAYCKTNNCYQYEAINRIFNKFFEVKNES
jgi:hypothetical protein